MISSVITRIYDFLSDRIDWGKVVLDLQPPIAEGFSGICIYPNYSEFDMTGDVYRSRNEIVLRVHCPFNLPTTAFLNRVEEVIALLASLSEITGMRIDYNAGNWCEISVTVPEIENIGR